MDGNLVTAASEPLGSFRASVHYSRYLGQQAQTAQTVRTGLVGALPEGRDPEAGKVQTTPGMPIVQVWDFKTNKGDRATVDMKGRYSEPPVVNDADQLERKESLKYARDEVVMSLFTHTGDPGGIMTRQRNPHDTRMDAMDASINWVGNFEDNLFMCHAFGARGYQEGEQWIIPLASDPRFQDIIGNPFDPDTGVRIGNPVLPPTRSRYYLPNDATGVNDLDSADGISLAFLTKMRAKINISAVPLAPVSSSELKRAGSSYEGNSSLLIGFLTEEQFVTIKTATGTGSFSQLIADANTRVDFNKHPAFADLERFLWAGVLWFKIPRAIEFPQGSSVDQYNPTTGVLETVTAAVRVHRGIILGAQALVDCLGDASVLPTAKSTGGMIGTGATPALMTPYSWVEDVRAGGAVLDLFIRIMKGTKKLRYTWKGVPYDNGVATFDTYQPPL